MDWSCHKERRGTDTNQTVSIIIPIHNTPDNIFTSCYRSIVNQTYTDIEIIIVNDRSSHDCLMNIRNMIKDNTKTKILHTEESGVSSARNVGVINSSGDYIMFVDSDDILNQDAIFEAVTIMNDKKVDIVIGRYKYYDADSINLNDLNFGSYSRETDVIVTGDPMILCKMYSGKDQKLHREKDGWIVSFHAPVARLVKRSAIKGIEFPKDVSISEDALWNFFLLRRSGIKVALSSCNWYAYIQYMTSAMHNDSRDFLDKINESVWYCIENIENHDEMFYAFFIPFSLTRLELILHYLFAKESEDCILSRFLRFKKICNDVPYKKVNLKNSPNIRCKLKYLMFRSGLAYPWYAAKKIFGLWG